MLGDKGKHSHKWQVGIPSHVKLRKYEWISHFLLETIQSMEVELDFRWVLQAIKQLKCKITESIFEVVMRFDDRWLPWNVSSYMAEGYMQTLWNLIFYNIHLKYECFLYFLYYHEYHGL